MTFDEHLEQILTLLQRDGRVTYRALKRRLDVDDDYLADLTAEIIEAKRLAVDEEGKVLVWTGPRGNGETDKGGNGEKEVISSQASVLSPQPLAPNTQPPIAYTPIHLADRIRAVAVTDGERKTITALFADLKGSTALIEGLDPEEARAVIDPALQVMMDAVHQYDGFVAQALGDGIFALFGAPLAHEDHPQRALYAALRMQEAMRRYADTLRQKGYPPLLMRVGINTGEVVLRSIRKDDLHTDYVPVGHSTNLAARMEQLAAPGSIVASAYTHKLTDGYFAFKDLGPTQIKGVEDALNIYEVLGAGPLRTRLQVSVRRGLTRFVGRQREMEQLQQALEQAKAGHGQIVGTMGEPGLGKSRLFHEFVGAYCNTPLHSQPTCLTLQAYSVSHGKASPYLPVIELLKSYFDIQVQDEDRKRREKVTGKVLTLDRSLEDTLPYLFVLLGIEEQPSPLAQMDAQIRRKRTFEALKKLFLRESLNQPLVLIFEDLHWIDEETQGFLDVLSESVASAKLLLLTNYRPEYRHEWGQKTYYTQLRLAPLGKAEAEEFLDVLLGEKGFPLPARERDRVRVDADALQPLKQLILDKTQGTPFFMEEIVQELVEQGVLKQDASVGWVVTHPTTALQLPPTVQGILAARIDRLAPDEKALLQQLSVIGREFPLSLVRQVIPQPEAELYRLLASLQRKEFLYEQPAIPEVEYIFKHALTQEVTYNSVLVERRKALHEQTAHAIEHIYKDKLEDHYTNLAHHYSRSGDTEKTIEYLHKAGQQAAHQAAHAAVVEYLAEALRLLATLPPSPERNQREIQLLTAYGPALIATKGMGASEVEHSYTRALELCRQVEDPTWLAPILHGLYVFYIGRGDLQKMTEIADQLFAFAQTTREPLALLFAHYRLCVPNFWRGAFVSSHAQVEQALLLYESRAAAIDTSLYGGSYPAVGSLVYAAMALWSLGYPDQARGSAQKALRLAEEITHSYSIAFALLFSAFLLLCMREGQPAQARAETCITFSRENAFPFPLAVASRTLGGAYLEQGQEQRGSEAIEQALAADHEAFVTLGGSYFLALLAKAYGSAGRIEEGLKIIAEGLEVMVRTDERWCEAEFYRLKGELTLQKLSVGSSQLSVTNPRSLTLDPQGEAEACFHKAIEIARKQQAKSLELRAATSLARLWQQQGKRTEAHQMLSEIYGWFTEGFETKDLQEAKALLAELGVNADENS